MFSIPIIVGPGCLPVDRGRSRPTGPIDGRTQTCTQPRLGGQLTVRELLLSGNGPGRPPGRPAESSALCFQCPVDRPIDWWLNGHNYDRWPVDRPVDRRGNLGFSRLQRAEFCGGYEYPILELFSPRISRAKFSIFQQVFKRVFVTPRSWRIRRHYCNVYTQVRSTFTYIR